MYGQPTSLNSLDLPNSLDAKLVILGSQGVGKTSLVARYITQYFSRYVSPTIGASFFSCNLQVLDHNLRLQVWDTAGQERFRSMAPLYYRKANAALLVFDICSRETFESIKSWISELHKNSDSPVTVLCLVGNKCDLEPKQVSYQEAEAFAQSIGGFYLEASAITGKGVNDIFMQIGTYLVQNHLSGVNGMFETDGQKDESISLDYTPNLIRQDKQESLCCFS